MYLQSSHYVSSVIVMIAVTLWGPHVILCAVLQTLY